MIYLISIILGLFPEVLYFTLFLVYTKQIETQKFKLFALTSVAYFIFVILAKYQVLAYILFIVSMYLILKLLYKEKTQVIDVFVISIACVYLTIISFTCSLFIQNNYMNYYVLLVMNKILLFIPFIFRNKFCDLYKQYCKLWNRNDAEKRPIKSITLRNTSLVILNSFIFILNILTVCVINTFSK